MPLSLCQSYAGLAFFVFRVLRFMFSLAPLCQSIIIRINFFYFFYIRDNSFLFLNKIYKKKILNKSPKIKIGGLGNEWMERE